MGKYKPHEIDTMLSSMIVLYDSREKLGDNLDKRLMGLNCPSERVKLNVGDYSLKYQNTAGEWQDGSYIATIERKQSFTEICSNFTAERARFAREFERGLETGIHMHLIIEDESYERLFAHKYRSQLLPQSLIASLLSWSIKYNFKVHYCRSETTPRLIHDILWYELRNYLLNH